MGQDSGQSTAGMACLCSMMFGASPGKTEMAKNWNYLGLLTHMLGTWTGMI